MARSAISVKSIPRITGRALEKSSRRERLIQIGHDVRNVLDAV